MSREIISAGILGVRMGVLAVLGTAIYVTPITLLEGCPPPAVAPQTVLAADGATITVTAYTACANLNAQCGTDQESCVVNITNLSGGSPLDLSCMTSAGSKTAAKACVGVGALCGP